MFKLRQKEQYIIKTRAVLFVRLALFILNPTARRKERSDGIAIAAKADRLSDIQDGSRKTKHLAKSKVRGTPDWGRTSGT